MRGTYSVPLTPVQLVDADSEDTGVVLTEEMTVGLGETLMKCFDECVKIQVDLDKSRDELRKVVGLYGSIVNINESLGLIGEEIEGRVSNQNHKIFILAAYNKFKVQNLAFYNWCL